MDTLVGVSGFVAGMTQTELDDLLNVGAVALKEDAAFMEKLRQIVDGPRIQSDPQALDIATILKIIAALKTLFDLIQGMRGGGLLPTPSSYNPATESRCL